MTSSRVASEAAGSGALDRPEGSPARIEVDSFGVTYANGARAVAGFTLTAPAGTVVSVLGRNGAGKTSLLRGLAGFLPGERVKLTGSVKLDGVEIGGSGPENTYRRGVVLIPERDKVFASISVEEHCRLVGIRRPEDLPVTEFSNLAGRWKSRAGVLSGGERQMLALGLAWAHKPKVLLIDELSLGLAPVVTKSLLRLVRERTATMDCAVIVVEQDATSALEVADMVCVLDRGAIVWSGTTSETTAETLSEAYLGGAP
jgi:ABC-type branched-subunit amino acid transport system ATPase component